MYDQVNSESKTEWWAIKDILAKFPEDYNSFETQLESTLKHLRSYIKVIKSHIPQLQAIMKTESHGYKDLENIELAPEATKLMKIFDEIQDKDLQWWEETLNELKRWQGWQNWQEANQQSSESQVNNNELNWSQE